MQPFHRLALVLRNRRVWEEESPKVSRCAAPSVLCPWIDERDPEIPEVTHVAGSQGRPPSGDDAGDFDVAEIDRSSRRSPFGCALPRLTGGLVIERQDASLQIFLHRTGEGVFELSPSATSREQPEAETNLEDCDGRRPY